MKKASKAAALRPGTDYVIAESPKGAGIVVPKSEIEPGRAIFGGFHALCADVGDIPGHPLSGYRAGDLLPQSLWNQTHRAACPDNAGMVYDPGIDMWVDIYLASEADGKIINLSFDEFVKRGEAIGKTLLSHEEFSSAAEGSNELTNIMGSSRPKRAGGNVDTLGRRMISNIGLEDCCGALWQWLSSLDPSDSDYQLLAGGYWFFGTFCGPRYRKAHCRWTPNSSIGARFRSEPLHKRVARSR